MNIPGGKGGTFQVGSEETSRWEVIKLTCGKGESFLVER